MKRPRILWLKSAIPWPLHQGTNFIAYNLFRLLSPECRIRYLALRGGPRDDPNLAALEEHVEVRRLQRPNTTSPVQRALWAAGLRARRALGYVPPEVWYELPGAYRTAVRREMRSGDYDLLFLHYWYLTELGDWLRDENVAVLLHDNEMDRLETEAASLPAGREKRERLRRARYVFESHLRMMDRVRRVFFYTKEDRDSFFRRAGREYGNAHVFPYYYRLGPMPDVVEEPARVVFTGKMSYLPNILAAERLAVRIWPLVRASRPDAELVLAGAAPGPDVLRLGSLEGVTVTGFVPDLRSLVRSATVYAAPVEVGGGLKIKLMEAAELERPIVATPFALQGFGFESDRDHLAADSDEEFADGIRRLLASEQLRRRLGSSAREGLLRRFSGPEVEERIRLLFREMTGS